MMLLFLLRNQEIQTLQISSLPIKVAAGGVDPSVTEGTSWQPKRMGNPAHAHEGYQQGTEHQGLQNPSSYLGKVKTVNY